MLGLALVVTLALAIPICLDNPELRTPSQTALFLAWLLAIHAALLGVVGVPAAALAAGLRHRAGGPDGSASRAARVAGLFTGIGTLVAINLCLRFTLAYALFRAPPASYLRALGLIDLVVFLAAVPVAFALATLITAPGGAGRRRAAWIGGLYAAVLGVTVTANLADEVPARADLRGLATERPVAADAVRTPENVMLLGVDALSWLVMKPLIEQGALPNFAALVEKGARAHLDNQIPTYSPIIWTTIATGRSEPYHHVHAFTRFVLDGMEAPVETAPLVSSINWWNGLNRLLSLLVRLGFARQELVPSTRWGEPAVWHVAAQHGVRTGVYRWLVTWPAAALASGGYMVTGREPTYHLPAAGDGPAFVPPPDPPQPPPGTLFSADRGLGKMWRALERISDDSLALHQHFRPRLSVAFTSVPDAVQHKYWRGPRQLSRWLSSDELHQPPSREVAAVYGIVDEWVGRLVAAAGDDTLVVIVSDHGYSFDGHEHHQAPPGVLLAAGPGVRPGALLDHASIFDVAPTVLAALGLPLSDELEGRVLTGLFLPGALPDRRSVARYEGIEMGPAEEAGRDLDIERQRVEELRALGYVN